MYQKEPLKGLLAHQKPFTRPFGSKPNAVMSFETEEYFLPIDRNTDTRAKGLGEDLARARFWAWSDFERAKLPCTAAPE